jgi:hypothetical protein
MVLLKTFTDRIRGRIGRLGRHLAASIDATAASPKWVSR